MISAYVTGTSSEKVVRPVKALGCDTGVSKSTVSRVCQEIDRDVAPVQQRPIEHTTYPHVFLDASYVKARVDH